MKKNIQTPLIFILVYCMTFCAVSCKKQDSFLETKPNDALAVPTTLKDLQLLLRNEALFNIYDPGLGQIASDDYYVSATILSNQSIMERNGYSWEKQVYNAGEDISDWSVSYKRVYVANTVLEYLSQIDYSDSQQSLADQIKGMALFYRAFAFYNLVQTFAMPYDVVNSKTDLGIPLRLSSDLNIKSTRATVQQCYDQIIQDLQTALRLLPLTSSNKTEPAQPEVNGLLARVYMAMGNYPQTFQHADACLSLYDTLIDYNTLTPNSRSISTTYLTEDIYHCAMSGYGINLTGRYSITDSVLYRSYVDNDLRKTVFFILTNGLPYFRGNYDYKRNVYSGIATDEVYLIRAECQARLGNIAGAMKDLNTLMVTRWKTGTFVPYTATSADDALKQVLTERRKELLYRGLRWTDLRRLNKESRFAVTLKRNLDGVIYTLAPNSVRYAWPIPDNEIQTSGIPQNAR